MQKAQGESRAKNKGHRGAQQLGISGSQIVFFSVNEQTEKSCLLRNADKPFT